MEINDEEMLRSNDIERMADLIGNSLVDAQCALYALIAIHEVSKRNPSLDGGLPLFSQIIWRALFDRMYLKIGTAIEKSDKAANIQNLKRNAVKHVSQDQEALAILSEISILQEKWEVLRVWRNKVIAHNDLAVDSLALYAGQKMHVSEYQPIIDGLFRILNTITIIAIQKGYEQPKWQHLYSEEATRLFSSNFEGMSKAVRP